MDKKPRLDEESWRMVVTITIVNSIILFFTYNQGTNVIIGGAVIGLLISFFIEYIRGWHNNG